MNNTEQKPHIKFQYCFTLMAVFFFNCELPVNDVDHFTNSFVAVVYYASIEVVYNYCLPFIQRKTTSISNGNRPITKKIDRKRENISVFKGIN